MGALAAILQSDPNLMRCQLQRLKAHVSMQDGDAAPDAYGFGYYQAGNVLLGKRPTGAPSALSLPDLVGRVDSEAVLVHARRATLGTAKDENTHPFRFRRWLFAHDGSIEGFDQVKPRLVEGLPDFLRRNIAGDTDSEHAFMWFLKLLRDEGSLDDLDLDAQVAGRALARTVRQVEAWCREVGEQRPSRLCFVATNGRSLVATRRGGPLFYALLEGIIPCELDEIGADTPESDPRVRPHRRVKAVCFASRLLAPNGFIEVPEGSVVSVSRTLQVTVSSLANA
ncbi:glutamine amidotransferase, class-II [Anaeromyxobacter dehalogenans 2CP-1]|uniref:Glutamine amidotransferase, class-II n=1 Tax=Anaeromyxobacter dehalogenans (strain ATCC BAA-258 / DSM 21875 / 2CP-1) TaxID=455488 RepID=B8JGN3_ANAD2|nr:class II glutamine amidotransferase [Anaeromyxobacter dehalogenans]ACL64704.1 glutamine amidotransferase, class-II [Anaeromyxobacter dehalogenans 2CP-1]